MVGLGPVICSTHFQISSDRSYFWCDDYLHLDRRSQQLLISSPVPSLCYWWSGALGAWQVCLRHSLLCCFPSPAYSSSFSIFLLLSIRHKHSINCSSCYILFVIGIVIVIPQHKVLITCSYYCVHHNSLRAYTHSITLSNDSFILLQDHNNISYKRLYTVSK